MTRAAVAEHLAAGYRCRLPAQRIHVRRFRLRIRRSRLLDLRPFGDDALSAEPPTAIARLRQLNLEKASGFTVQSLIRLIFSGLFIYGMISLIIGGGSSGVDIE